LNPGIYVIAGGGFSVTGNGSVGVSATAKPSPDTGAGVLIYNAGTGYPTTGKGGTFGAVNLSGNGTISLTAPTLGAYTGIVLFQERGDAGAVSLSGNGLLMPAGITVYAPAAPLTISGNGQFKGSVVVNTLSLSGNTVAQLTGGGGGVVYSPAQVRTAYGINNVALDGTGQTIAVVDAYDTPDISQALNAFDAQFGATSSGTTLDQMYGPASSFLTVVNQRGQTTALPATDPAGIGDNWETETALDVEWAHAVAPGAHVVLVEADSQSLADLMSAVKTAAALPGVSVVSMSWGFVEGQDVLAADEAMYDSYFTTPAGHTGVTFVASTGDYGAAVPLYPAMSPDVVAVGGTTLTLNADNSYKGEVGWGSYNSSLGLFLGGGGGPSQYEAEPAYQRGVQSTGSRTTPDVALLADPATGVWVADPYNLGSDDPWEAVGGTSLSAPAWAGLFAVADQGRVASGKATLGTAGPTEALTALYGLPQSDYHAITGGNNGYAAGPGYNLVAGLGTPVADRLVADLVAYAGGPASPTPVAPIAASGLVYGGGSGAAVSRSAALRAFPAGSTDSPLPATAERKPAPAQPPAAVAAPGAAVAGPARGGPIVAVADADFTPRAGSLTLPAGPRADGSLESAASAPAWSPVLLDASTPAGPLPALAGGALRPEMPADRGGDVLVGGTGEDLLLGGEGQNLLVGGYADGSGQTAHDAAPFDDGGLGAVSVDEYFLRTGEGEN
ncbi:MAG TPA: hypothetical protein VFW33_11390, partial [Gemmataceae bacterium]|nr:hypothetical protein [Gemmataceae bacterium]